MRATSWHTTAVGLTILLWQVGHEGRHHVSCTSYGIMWRAFITDPTAHAPPEVRDDALRLACAAAHEHPLPGGPVLRVHDGEQGVRQQHVHVHPARY